MISESEDQEIYIYASLLFFLVTNCTWFWATVSFLLSGMLEQYLERNVDAVNIVGAKYKKAGFMLMAAAE